MVTLKYKNIMKKLVMFFLSYILFSGISFANTASIFSEANEAYKKSQFDTAEVLYDSIIKTGFETPELYFNLGNVYFKKKDIANAMLNYERARKLSPGDDEINFNLQLAQTMVTDKINILPEFFLNRWWRNFAELYSSDHWAVFSICFFISFLFFSILYLFANRMWIKKISFWIGIVLLALCLVTFSNSWFNKQTYQDHSGAIVMNPSVTIKSSPDENGTELFVIHEGAKVWVTDEVGEWLKIKIADGNNGWLKKVDIRAI
jgi:tetratricopeptide (TPR) repeat protein